MTVEPLRAVRDRLSEFVDRVQRQHERVVITSNGTPAAVLISPEDLEALEETLEVLGHTEVLQGLREAEVAVSLDNPRVVGKPLRRDLDGIWSARRGTYRVLYRIDEDLREVVVLRISYRSRTA